jgi:hypothetical protein
MAAELTGEAYEENNAFNATVKPRECITKGFVLRTIRIERLKRLVERIRHVSRWQSNELSDRPVEGLVTYFSSARMQHKE